MKNLNADKDMLAEMRAILDLECKKPAKKRNYELICQLTDTIYHATSRLDISEIEKQEIEKIFISGAKTSKQMRWKRVLTVAFACITMFLGFNVWTYHVHSMNAFEFIYRIVPGGIQINQDRLDPGFNSNPLLSEDDPYGIRSKCLELGFDPLVPSYIPDGMSLSDYSENDGDVKFLSFTYKDGNKYIGIGYAYSQDEESYKDIITGLPSDQYNIHTETICGRTVVISWEDQIFRAVFCENQTVYNVSCKKLSYDTAYHVLVSYFI